MNQAKIARLKEQRAKTTFKDKKVYWEGISIDKDEDGYVYVPQGSHLGDTLISLDDTYEESGEDCLYVSDVINAIPELIAEIEKLRDGMNRIKRQARFSIDKEHERNGLLITIDIVDSTLLGEGNTES